MKAVIFDFDGTLTCKGPNIWEKIWKELGYLTDDSSDFARLFKQFSANEISHQEWCDLTCNFFIEKGLNKQTIKNLTKDIKLIEGIDETLIALKMQGVATHIVSGNMDEVIYDVLKDKEKYFDSISANTMIFDKNGAIKKIAGTNYDFEGKAKFISEYCQKTGIPAQEITFIGNSNNDEWAHLSGCKTLCINPDNTDTANKTVWNNVMGNVENLQSILPMLGVGKDK